MTVTADALDMIAGDPPRYPHIPGDFHRHPETGAPYVNHPTETTKDGTPRRVMYGRPSSFGSALDNPFNLIKWKDRLELVGAALMDLDYGYVLANRDAPKVLDALAAKCYEFAGANLAADRGTHIHKLLETIDQGRPFDELIDDGERLGIHGDLQVHVVQQWLDFRQRLGVEALAVEQTVVNDRWRLAGTLDRLDVADHDILTAYGIIDMARPFVGDIKTGGLTLGTDGQPNYWVKYPVQLVGYVDGVPYDVDNDERQRWIPAPPNPDVALVYHYDLARALNGEPVDWQAIPVNLAAGREGGDLCRAAADFAKRRDLFAMPAPQIAVPVAVDSVVVEQLVAVPVPAGTATEPDRLRARIAELVAAGHEQMMRRHWPEGVPGLKRDGHTADQLQRILAAVRSVESLVGAPWHPDDAPGPSVRLAQKEALRAWEGRDPNELWFAAACMATFEQCRNPDATIESLVGSFTIEQAERLRDAAKGHP